jgi:hypothetical protein
LIALAFSLGGPSLKYNYVNLPIFLMFFFYGFEYLWNTFQSRKILLVSVLSLLVVYQIYSTARQLYTVMPEHYLVKHEFKQSTLLATAMKKVISEFNLPVLGISPYAVDSARYYLYPDELALVLSESEFQNFGQFIARVHTFFKASEYFILASKGSWSTLLVGYEVKCGAPGSMQVGTQEYVTLRCRI